MASTSRVSGTEKKSHASGRSNKKVGDLNLIGGVAASKAIFYEQAAGRKISREDAGRH